MNQNPTAPNLTTFTRWGRRGVKYGTIFLVVYLVGRVLLGAFIGYWKTINPPPPPPPTVGFGKLPNLNFPASKVSPKSFTLETATGKFPNMPDRAKVFLMPKKAPSLLDDEKAKKVAAQYDFVFEPEVINPRTYRFYKTKPLSSTFDLDIIEHVFHFSTDYLNRPDLNLNSNLPTNFDAANLVKNFVKVAGNIEDDIATASAEITYLKSSSGQLVKAVSASDADFIQVDLNRAPIDGLYPMYTQQGTKGVVSAIVSGFFRNTDSIVEARNYYYPVDYSSVQTYPLRDVKNAWRNLQAGEGLIIEAGKNDEAIVRDISLGYYDDINGQEYLQPVYVFMGDDDFLALTTAIDPAYVQTIN